MTLSRREKARLWRKLNWLPQKWLRWQIASYLNNKCKDACWFELCMWALGYHSFRETFIEDRWKSQYCTEEEGAYCGKCYNTGRLSK